VSQLTNDGGGSVGVAVGPGVLVRVAVAVAVGVFVRVAVAVGVFVRVGVLLGVAVLVGVAVLLGVDVGPVVAVAVGVCVGVAVSLGGAVGFWVGSGAPLGGFRARGTKTQRVMLQSGAAARETPNEANRARVSARTRRRMILLHISNDDPLRAKDIRERPLKTNAPRTPHPYSNNASTFVAFAL
jgi:hypothetical protein